MMKGRALVIKRLSQICDAFGHTILTASLTDLISEREEARLSEQHTILVNYVTDMKRKGLNHPQTQREQN